MKSFPIFLNVEGRDVVIIGGGEAAAQKARLVLKTEARLTLVAPDLTRELADLARSGRAAHVAAVIDPAALRGAALVFVCTGCAAADAAAAALAKAAGAVVNVVDRPALCDATTPAIVDRDPLVVAIGTEGAAPVLARQVKTRIEALLEPGLGRLTALAGALRDRVAFKLPMAKRRAFWSWVFSGAPREAFARGDAAHAEALIDAAIEAGGLEAGAGLVSLVGAGPGSADLVTLRAVRRLQEADVIFYDRLVDPSVLELARRDAKRVYVGKAHGAALAWPQARINARIVAAARDGARVVRLKCGDPLVFGRAGEEAAACEAAGVPWEIVPGVTSALAAAAKAGIFPTERGRTQRLTLATGVSAVGRPRPAHAAAVSPGATAAFYMSVAEAAALQDDLLSAGAPAALPATIVERAETDGERVIETTLGDLGETVAAETVRSPAILFVQWPETVAAAAAADDRRAAVA